MAKVRQYISRESSLGGSIKFILLGAVAVLIVMLVLPPVLNNFAPDPETGLKTTLTKPNKSKDIEKTAAISNLVYEGKTDNAHFKITAKALNKEADGLDLTEPSAVLTSDNGITTTIIAKMGTYNSAKQTIVLNDNVEITSNRNTFLQSRHITIDIKTNTITSHGRTIINRDGLKMEGDGAIITDDNVFKLQGNIKLVQTENG